MLDFTDRVALVTGASGALGGALARRLVAAGAWVETLDRSAEKSAAALADLAAGDRLVTHGADLADAGAVRAVVDGILARRGRVDLLFNAAGAFAAEGPVEATSPATWRRMLDANLFATLHPCAAVVPAMKRRGAGAIVNVGSRAALAGGAGVAAYAVAKTAVLRLTESLAAEGKRHGLRVNCVLPGTIDTPANRRAMPDADPGEWVELEALVDAMLFLASPASRAVNGVALEVFGPG